MVGVFGLMANDANSDDGSQKYAHTHTTHAHVQLPGRVLFGFSSFG